MVTFYSFPQEHWRHLRTTNIVESPFASVRLRTDASRRYKRVEGAKAIIRRMLRIAETEAERAGATAAGGLRRDAQRWSDDKVRKCGERREPSTGKDCRLKPIYTPLYGGFKWIDATQLED